MTFVKRISLFFTLPLGMFVLGFYTHMLLQKPSFQEEPPANVRIQEESKTKDPAQTEVLPVSGEQEAVIRADTRYVIEEVDLEKHTSVETSWRIPEKYIGLDRKAFVKEMASYQKAPSLKDQELGFVSVEVLVFSEEKVVLRKSYRYPVKNQGFYLVNQKNYVVVFCEDLKTVYMNTNILLDELPETLRQEIIQKKFIETEEELYNFLESYSS